MREIFNLNQNPSGICIGGDYPCGTSVVTLKAGRKYYTLIVHRDHYHTWVDMVHGKDEHKGTKHGINFESKCFVYVTREMLEQWEEIEEAMTTWYRFAVKHNLI